MYSRRGDQGHASSSQLSIRQFATASGLRVNSGNTNRQRRGGASGVSVLAGGTQKPPFSIGPGESRSVVCAVYASNDVSRSVGLAFINIPINEAVLTSVSDTQFYPQTIHKIQMMEASRILMPPNAPAPDSGLALRTHIEEELRGVPIVETPKADWSESEGMHYIRDIAFKADLPALEFAVTDNFYTICAFSAAMKYIYEDYRFSFEQHSVRIKYQPPADTMMISLPTIRSLELIQNAQNPNSRESLFGILKRTVTPMGSRILRSSILQPSTEASVLDLRFDAVGELARNEELLSGVQNALDELKRLGDVERLLTKLVILPKDGSVYESEQAINNILKLKSFLAATPQFFNSLSIATSALLLDIYQNWQPEPADELMQIISDTIDHHATFATKPLELRNQRVHTVKPEISVNLDIQRKLYEDFCTEIHDYVNNLESELGAKVGLKYTDTRKFYLRVSAKDFGPRGLPAILINRARAKDSIECQTLKLVEYNERINRVVDGAVTESDEAIRELLSDIRPRVHVLFKYCESIAVVDLLASFANLVRTYNYVRPEIHNNVFSLIAARHPIIDARGVDKYVPNDYFITEETRFHIITGCNMGGKSTYIRAIAMVQIMAQIGCYVPAESAQLPIFHNLFARVSTDDQLEANLSTFSVEMREMAFILRNVNNKSLVIVDELGRGTGTRDGLAIATAMSEALLQSGATVYFATHFIELAKALAHRIGVVNRHLMTETHRPAPDSGDIPVVKMLYRVGDGVETEVGYGITLAKAVGFPTSFIARAEKVAAELRQRAQAGSSSRHEVEQAKRAKLVRNLVRQLRLAQQSDADDEELWAYLKQIRDDFWAKMLENSEDDDKNEPVIDTVSDDGGEHEKPANEEQGSYAVKEPACIEILDDNDDIDDEYGYPGDNDLDMLADAIEDDDQEF